jgi:hypothetical protein
VLWQLALEALAQVHRATPRSQVAKLAASCVVLAGVGAIACGRTYRSGVGAALGAAAGLTLAAALTLTVLRPSYPLRSPDAGHCFVTVPGVLSGDGVTNLLLFAPTAFLVALAVGRPRAVVLTAAIGSAVVEWAQALREVGVCDSSDVVLNTLGALLAVGAASCLRPLLRRAVPGSGPCRSSC